MFELLLVLVKNPGRVLEKDFLLKAVWPDSFVEEGNISFNIRQLRKALGDDAQAPSYIETVPRRGYRFVAEVEEVGPEPVSENGSSISPVQTVDKTPHHVKRFLLSAITAFVLIGGSIITGLWFVQNRGFEAAPILSAPLASEKLSTDGRVYHAVISLDGKNLVYTHRSGGKQSLWLRQLETSNNVQIIPPSDHFYGGLAISPDGNVVYFVRGSQQVPQTDIYRMPIFGGVPQKIIDGTQGWISVSSDGEKVSFVRCPYGDDEYCSLYVADSLDGKNERKLVSRPRPIRIGDNKISPDGKTVAFASGQSRTSSNEFSFVEVDIENRTERELTLQKFFNISYLAWLPDQSGMLLTAMKLPDRNYRIWKVSASTGEASKLTADSETYSRLSLDAKASMLVSTQVEADFHLNVFQTENPDAAPRVLTNAATVAFAPNGKIIFSSIMTGDSEIWSISADGSEQRQLTNDPSGDMAPIVSPDNNFIFFESDRTGEIHVWRMNTDGTNQTQVTTNEGGFPLIVSPDGYWLYYRSGLNNTLRRVAIGHGQEELVLNEMGRNLTVSPDTSRAAFSERQNQEILLTIVSLPDAKPIKTFKISDPGTTLAHLAWSQDGKYLAYVLTDDKKENGKLWFQRLDSDTPQQIADLSGDSIAELSGLALSPDGKSFAVIKGNWKHDAVLLRGLR